MVYNQTVEPSPSAFTQIRKIDNIRHQLPLVSFLLIAVLLYLAVWFFRGGSFRLYASLFFGLYYLTGQVWISVILIGILQNLAFMPLHFLSLRLSANLKDFEEAIDNTKSEADQYFLFKEKIKKGDWTVSFYILNFVVHAIAFLSAGRIFLIDFYTQALNPKLIYHFIPYPKYPLLGTFFKFPWFKITHTFALDWSVIWKIWLIILLIFVIPRLVWRLVRWIFWRNQRLLSARINYNHLLVWIGSFIGTVFLVSLYVFRHLPGAFQGLLLLADLTRQNTTMNFITAVGTFLTTVHAGYTHNSLASGEARKAGIAPEIITLVFKANMRQSVKNAVILGMGAFLITNQIPCAFELSVATFEVLYIISPYTFDRFLVSSQPKSQPPPSPSSIPAA